MNEGLYVLVGVLTSLFVGLLGFVGVLLRSRNSKVPDHNPGNPVDLGAIHTRFDRLEDKVGLSAADLHKKLDDVTSTLSKIATLLDERLPKARG